MFNLKIKKLFSKYDYDLKFNDKLNVLVGENGCGKSTILRIINYILSHDYLELIDVEFEAIKLTVHNKEVIINYDDLLQINFTASPEFRFYFKELLNKSYENFDEFFNEILSLEKIMHKDIPLINNNVKYIKDKERFLNDDDCVFNIPGYVDYMMRFNFIYGSKIYFRYIYYFLSKTNNFFNIKSNFYSLVDLNNSINICINDNVIKILNDFMPEKVFTLSKNELLISDKSLGTLIEHHQLSSGELKLIILLSIIYNSTSDDVILIDEPELSLSIYWQRRIIDLILNELNSYSIILATQSSFLLSYEQLEYMIPLYYEEEE